MARWTADTKNIHSLFFKSAESEPSLGHLAPKSTFAFFFFFYRIPPFGVVRINEIMDTLYIDFGLMEKRCLFTH